MTNPMVTTHQDTQASLDEATIRNQATQIQELRAAFARERERWAAERDLLQAEKAQLDQYVDRLTAELRGDGEG